METNKVSLTIIQAFYQRHLLDPKLGRGKLTEYRGLTELTRHMLDCGEAEAAVICRAEHFRGRNYTEKAFQAMGFPLSVSAKH